METAEKPVQNTKKKRSQSDKIGRLKYNQQLLKQTLAEVEEVKLMLRTIFAGLKGSFNFEQSLIERVACEDEIDREILRLLFEAGSQLSFDLLCFTVTALTVTNNSQPVIISFNSKIASYLFVG